MSEELLRIYTERDFLKVQEDLDNFERRVRIAVHFASKERERSPKWRQVPISSIHIYICKYSEGNEILSIQLSYLVCCGAIWSQCQNYANFCKSSTLKKKKTRSRIFDSWRTGPSNYFLSSLIRKFVLLSVLIIDQTSQYRTKTLNKETKSDHFNLE